MNRERELLKRMLDQHLRYGGYLAREHFEAVTAILSQPEAEPSKTVYGVLATAYRPPQHEASMAAVSRHKEPSISETDAAAFDHLVIHNIHDGMKLRKYVKSDDVHEILSVCAKLERQRDELRAENEKLKDALNMATEGKYSALMLELADERAKKLHDALQVSILKA